MSLARRRLVTGIVAAGLILLQPIPGVAMCWCPHLGSPPADIDRSAGHPRVDCRRDAPGSGGSMCASSACGATGLEGEAARTACGSPDAAAPAAAPLDDVLAFRAPACTSGLSDGTDLPDAQLPPPPMPALDGAHVACSAAPPHADETPPRWVGGHPPRAGPVPIYALGAAYLI